MTAQSAAGWTLVFLTQPSPGRSVPLGPVTRIGRQPGNELVVADAGVSRMHAVIEWQPDGYWLRDLGSSNGTYVNEERVAGPLRLLPGMRIRVGQVVLAVDAPAGVAAPPPLQQVIPASPRPAPSTAIYPQGPPGVAPAAAPPADSPPAGGQRRGCWRACLVLALVGFCLVALLGGVGYYLVTTGRLTPTSIQAQLSGATGTIQLTNLDEVAVEVDLLQLPDTDDSLGDSRTLQPLDRAGFGALTPGLYRLTFDGTVSRTCTLRMNRGDAYRFEITRLGILVRLEGETPGSAADLRVAQSPLCAVTP